VLRPRMVVYLRDRDERRVGLDAGQKERAMSDTVVVYATSSGGTTIDRDAQGGNPFATALIDMSTEESLPLHRLLPRLRSRTMELSGGWQTPEHTASSSTWCLCHRPSVVDSERRVALVLVVSDYSGAQAGADLDGAAHDERRVAAMLALNGFSVEQGVAPTRADILSTLRAFRRRTTDADVGLIYCTGHGVESNGDVFLLPGDFPLRAGLNARAVRSFGVNVDRIQAALSGRAVNLLFFAGCRTHVRTGA
jgi:caspase domain-containing protein